MKIEIPASVTDRTRDALQRLESHMNKQSNYVQGVQVLSNVSVDVDRSLHLRSLYDDAPDVLTGLIVTVKPQYKLSVQDASWLYPDLGRGRSMFDADNVDTSAIHDIEVGAFHDSVTINRVLDIDEWGNTSEKSSLIIDSAMDSINGWDFINNDSTMSNLMEKWMDNEGVNGLDARAGIAQDLGCDKVAYEDISVGLYSDGQNIYHANHAVKVDEESQGVLVRHSALGGYRMKDISHEVAFVPSDYGYSEKTYNFANLDDRTKGRIKSKFFWKNGDTFNTLVIRPPALKQNGDKPGEILRTDMGMFSANRVSHMMSAEELVEAAPHDALIQVPVDMMHDLFSALVHAHKHLDTCGFHIFGRDVSEGSMAVPMRIIHEVANANDL